MRHTREVVAASARISAACSHSCDSAMLTAQCGEMFKRRWRMSHVTDIKRRSRLSGGEGVVVMSGCLGLSEPPCQMLRTVG